MCCSGWAEFLGMLAPSVVDVRHLSTEVADEIRQQEADAAQEGRRWHV